MQIDGGIIYMVVWGTFVIGFLVRKWLIERRIERRNENV